MEGRKLTPSWTRAFQVCSSFLMNLQRENTQNVSQTFGSRSFLPEQSCPKGTLGDVWRRCVVIPNAGALGIKWWRSPGLEEIGCLLHQPEATSPLSCPALSPSLPVCSCHHHCSGEVKRLWWLAFHERQMASMSWSLSFLSLPELG